METCNSNTKVKKRGWMQNLCLWTRISDCENQINNCEIRISDCENRITDCEKRINETTKEKIDNSKQEKKSETAATTIKKSTLAKIREVIIPLLSLVIILCIVIDVINYININISIDDNHFIYKFILTKEHKLAAEIALPFFALICLLKYYFRYGQKDKTNNKVKKQLHKVGNEITRIFFWIFSVNGFLFIILCTIVILLIFFIYSFSDIEEAKGKLELTALTLTISLAAIIPAVITKVMNKSEIESITEEKLTEKLERFNANLHAIKKDKAHEGRMSASLLYEFAKQQEKNEDYRFAIKNAAWSIGWASTAVGNYLNIKNEYKKSLEYVNELLEKYIKDSYDLILRCEKKLGNNIDKELLRTRDLRSIIIMHSLTRLYGYPDGHETLIIKLEELFIKYNPKIGLSSIDCQIFGMDDEFNKKLKKIADDIITSLNKQKKEG